MGRPRTTEDENLLAVARRVFLERGHGASTRELARAAGVSQAVLFQRFGTKEDLFFRAMLPPPPDVEALLGDIGEAREAGPRVHLVDVCVRILSWLKATAPVVLMVTTHPTAKHVLARAHDAIGAGAVRASLASRIEALSDQGLVSAPDPQAAADLLLAALHATALGGADENGSSSERTAVERLVGAFWAGLEPSPGEPVGGGDIRR